MNDPTRFLVAPLLACVALAAPGCGGADPSSAGASPPLDAPAFTRTIVVLHADGTEDVRQEPVTAAQQAADVEARNRRAQAAASGAPPIREDIAQDTGCAESSLWLYDQTGFVGNELCFAGAGSASLAAYCHEAVNLGTRHYCLQSWVGVTRSYYAGTEWGELEVPVNPSCTPPSPGESYCSESFGAWKAVPVAGVVAQTSTIAWLGN